MLTGNNDSRGDVFSDRRQIDGQDYTVKYTRDDAGQIARVTYPSGLTHRVTRETEGRPWRSHIRFSDTAPWRKVLHGLRYKAFGGLDRMVADLLTEPLVVYRSYDTEGRVTRRAIWRDGDGIVLSDTRYYFDAADRITRIRDHLDHPAGTEDYTYDATGRLVTATGPYGAIGYSYDANGNRLSRSLATSTATTSETYAIDPASNRLVSVTDDATGLADYAFAYDPGGFPTNRTLGALTESLTYTGPGQLKTLDHPTVTLLTSVFGHDGRRIKASFEVASGLDERHFIYDLEGRLIAEIDVATGAPLVEYLWLTDEGWAAPTYLIDYAAVIAGTTTEPTLYLIESDHLGVPVALYDEAGVKVWEQKRLPFGAASGPATGPLAATLTTALTLPGQYADPVSLGFVDNWMRTYNPLLGRYLQPDPIGLSGGLNRYGYAGGDPVHRVDPRGEVAPAVVACGLNPGCRQAVIETAKMCVAVGIVIYDYFSEDDGDLCDMAREEEEQDCWDNYGSVFGSGDWRYRACMDRASTRWQICKRTGAPPVSPPPWSDADIDGFPTIHE